MPPMSSCGLESKILLDKKAGGEGVDSLFQRTMSLVCTIVYARKQTNIPMSTPPNLYKTTSEVLYTT